MGYVFFFQAEDGIRDLVRSRGLGDVYKRQIQPMLLDKKVHGRHHAGLWRPDERKGLGFEVAKGCLLYTSDAADDLLCVDLGGRRIIQKHHPLERQHLSTSAPQLLSHSATPSP